jgi:hypothetical protein
MRQREAACSCGQLSLSVEGEPVQARFARERVHVSGHSHNWVRTSDEGEPRTYSFCPECGATVFYVSSSEPSLIAMPVGAFADPAFPPPQRSV